FPLSSPLFFSHSLKDENSDFYFRTTPIKAFEGSTANLLFNAQVTLSDLLAIPKKLDTLIPS
ncbi:hypothetical protein KYX90_13715, partial [Enterococcus lactis]|nr:hypothetical protein [Enterococcus lactis]